MNYNFVLTVVMRVIILLVIFPSSLLAQTFNLPFGLEFGTDKSFSNFETTVENSHDICSLNRLPLFEYYYVVINPEEKKLTDKVHSVLNIQFEFKNLRTKNGRDHFLSYQRIWDKKAIEKYPAVKRDYNRYLSSKRYKDAKFILESLYSSLEFQNFLKFSPPNNKIETAILDIGRGKICGEFLNNKLIQIGLNKKEFHKDFDNITMKIVDKYKGKSSVFNLKSDKDNKRVCGSYNSKACVITVFTANLDVKTKLTMEYFDKGYESGFFSKPLPARRRAQRIPFITYIDRVALKNLQDKYWAISDNYKNVMRPIYLLLSKLIDKIKSKDDAITDSFVDQF